MSYTLWPTSRGRWPGSAAAFLLKQQLQLAADLAQAPHHFLVLNFFERRHLAANGEGSAGFENALLHLVQPGETLAVQDGHQFRARQQLPGERVLHHTAVLDQHRRFPLEELESVRASPPRG